MLSAGRQSTYSNAFLFFCLMVLLPGSSSSRPETAPEKNWTKPASIWAGYVFWPSINTDGTRIVALEAYSGADDMHRNVMVTEFLNGAWLSPILIGANGVYSDSNFQVLPEQTHPVVSGDGKTIAYLGATGKIYPEESYAVYIADRVNGAWNKPYILCQGLGNYHWQVSISEDGNTVAFSDYPFLGTQHVCICTRVNATWGGPVQIPAGTASCGMPSLSADGKKLALISNGQVWFSEKKDNGWATISQLTTNFWGDAMMESPHMSGDGLSLFFWKVTLVPKDGVYVRTVQDLYVMRRNGLVWGTAVKVNQSPIIPAFTIDYPAAINFDGTLAVYSRTTQTGDTISSAILESSEFANGAWSAPVPLTTTQNYNYDRYAVMSGDSSALVFSKTSGLMIMNSTPAVIRQRDDFIGTWAGDGVYSRNSNTGEWLKITAAATKIVAGDLDGDGVDDLIGIWPESGGVWVQFSKSKQWQKISSAADAIATGDMNGDGRTDFIGSWRDDGVYYRDSVSAVWTKLSSYAIQIAAGDMDGDGTEDLIGIWPSSAGIWVHYSKSNQWANLASTADWIATGDMNGDGRADLLGSWMNSGVYYRDSSNGNWMQLSSYATQVAAGDLDGDGTDDLIGIWPSSGGAWARLSATGEWIKLSSSPAWIAAGRLRS